MEDVEGTPAEEAVEPEVVESEPETESEEGDGEDEDATSE